MIFHYRVVTNTGEKKEGTVDAPTRDIAIIGLQRRGFIVTSIKGDDKKSILQMSIFESVQTKEVVILSRQISTLFEAQVSALKAFSLLAGNSENPFMRKALNQIVDDLQAGFSISGAMEKHPKIFSLFYVNMVRAGEESGKLNETFQYLADYLDRDYNLMSKTRNAFIYPAFVIVVFFIVTTLMMTLVIPKLSVFIQETGQAIPIYTRIVITTSNIVVNYGFIIIGVLLLGVLYTWWLSRSEEGKNYIENLKLSIPVIGPLYKKVYLARIADNLNTMLSSGISIIRAIEITGNVVGSKTYSIIMKEAGEAVKGGKPLSDALGIYEQVPQILVQMVKVGEETGSLGSILKTLATFYRREVDDAIDTMISLIEPVMIVVLGLGVGTLIASILIPIYNIASGI